jgi:hypothetical protein
LHREQREKIFYCTTGSPTILSRRCHRRVREPNEWIEAKDTFKAAPDA